MSSTGGEALARAIEEVGDGLLVVLTGAGISAPSGLPVFRGPDPDAIWSRDVTEIGTIAAFEQDPVFWWRWFLARFGNVEHASPNPAHYAVAALERWQNARGGLFFLITQNVDTLHERAGSKIMAKVHGTIDRLRCSRNGCKAGAPSGSLPLSVFDVKKWLEDPSYETLPRCPHCKHLVRAHVLLFDESYGEHDDYRYDHASAALYVMNMMLLVGTSLSVGITEMAKISAIMRGVPATRIDPGTDANGWSTHCRANAEEILPEVCRILGAAMD